MLLSPPPASALPAALAAARASLVMAFLLLAVFPHHSARAGIIRIYSAHGHDLLDVACPANGSVSPFSAILSASGADNWIALFSHTNECSGSGQISSMVACDSTGSLVYSTFSGPTCQNLTSSQRFRPASISSGGSCFKLPREVYNYAGGLLFADCSSPTAIPALARENGAVFLTTKSGSCPPDGVSLASQMGAPTADILVAFPRTLAPENTCVSERYKDWPNFQVDFNADGRSGTLSGCQEASFSTDIPAAPSCSTSSFRIVDEHGIVHDSVFAYQVIPAPSRLSAGAIAGITIGVLAMCGIAGFFGYRYYRQRQQQSQASAQLAGSESLIGSASGVQYEPVSGAYVKIPATV